MDRRSWLWRRKSSDKSPGETESSGGSISSNSGRFLDDQVSLNQHSHSPEITSKADAHSEHNNGMMTLNEALMSINAKEELVKQHVKVAEEAVSGWEKAEREVLALRQQVEFLSTRNSTLEDRVIHLDGALKECLRQLRQTREEKDQFAHDALDKKLSETESSLTSTDTELYHKLEIVEKENTELKLKLSSMTEELELRFIEKELSNKAAEQASKQYLDSVKKVAKFEAECRRLTSTLRKVNNSQPEPRKTPYVINGEFSNIHISERNEMGPVVDLDLMDDFLEMERLVGMPKRFEDENKIVEKNRENELKASRILIKEVESKLNVRENELKASNERLKEAESKLVELENELIVSRNQLEEAEFKLVERENELNSSRSQLEEAELTLDMHEKEIKTYKHLLEESESKLATHEEELKASRNQIKEMESKLDKRENELKASRKKFEEAESKLAEQENELNLSRKQLDETESKLKTREKELRASTYLLEDAESKLDETKRHLDIAESQCDTYKAELQILILKGEYLENDVQKERNISVKAEAKCRELENEVSKLQHEVQGTKSENRAEELRLLRVKQDTELAMAGSKFAECQKTIASLSRQLQTLATLDDYLIDTDDS